MTIRTLMATAFITTVLHHTLNQKRQFSFLVIAWSKKINGFYLTKNLCQQWNIKAISHTNTVDPAKYLNQIQLPLNKYGTIEFAKNFKNFLYKFNWRDLDNSRGFYQYEASFPTFVRNEWKFEWKRKWRINTLFWIS